MTKLKVLTYHEEVGLIITVCHVIAKDKIVNVFFQTEDGMNKYKSIGLGHASGPNVDRSKEQIGFERIVETRPLKEGDILVECK